MPPLLRASWFVVLDVASDDFALSNNAVGALTATVKPGNVCSAVILYGTVTRSLAASSVGIEPRNSILKDRRRKPCAMLISPWPDYPRAHPTGCARRTFRWSPRRRSMKSGARAGDASSSASDNMQIKGRDIMIGLIAAAAGVAATIAATGAGTPVAPSDKGCRDCPPSHWAR